MKILLVNKFHYIKGGSETYYFGLADLLRAHGHEVIFFSMKDEKNFPCSEEKYFVENVDFNAPMSKLATAKAAWRMLYSREAKKKFEALLLAEKPDLIHLNIFQSQLTGSIVDVAKKHGIPMVYTAHDLKSVCPNYQMLNHGAVCEKCLGGKYGNCAKEKCMKDSGAKSLLATMEARTYRFRKIYKKIDYVITPSRFYREKLKESGVFDCEIEYMANFLADDSLYATAPSEGDYFLYFGRLSREKGVPTLIKAYATLKTDRKLLVVGTGPVAEQAKETVKELHLEDRVELPGFKSGEDLKNTVKGARCVILPSEWYENGPYSAMEAMAAGKPIIASRYGGLPELVEEGRTGYIFTPGDAEGLAAALGKMDALSESEVLAMSLENIEKAKVMFGKEQYYTRLLQIYESLIGANGTDREDKEK